MPYGETGVSFGVVSGDFGAVGPVGEEGKFFKYLSAKDARVN